MSVDHPDNRGVFIELWVLDLVDGDHSVAMYLSQLLWWHQPAKDGSIKARHERDGHRWLLRADDEWWDECRLSARTVGRVKRTLKQLGLIEVRRFKWRGSPVSATRPLFAAIRERAATQSELTRSRDNPGIDAIASERIDAIASEPKKKTSGVDLCDTPVSPATDESVSDERAQPLRLLTESGERTLDDEFEEWWEFYADGQRRIGKREARAEFRAAVKRLGGWRKAEPVIVEGTNRWNRQWADEKREPMHIPHPARWLHREDYEAVPEPVKKRRTR